MTQFLLLRCWQVRVLALLAFSYLLASPATAQTVQAPAWQSAIGLSGNYSVVTEAVADSNGYVYIGGTFSGTARFGTISLSSAGNNDGFVAKLNPATNTFVWAQRWGGPDQDEVYAIAVRGTSIYIAGLGTGNGVRLGTLPVIDCYRTDAIIAKLVDAGATSTFAWAYGAGGTYSDVASGIVATSNGVYVAGSSASGYMLFGTQIYGGNAGNDGFVAKYIDAGNSASVAWVQMVADTGYDVISRIAAGPSGGIFVVGSTNSSTLSFGSHTLANTSPAKTDGFVAKLLDQGNTSTWQWVRGVNGPDNEQVTALAVAGSNVYIGGYFPGANVTLGSFTLAVFPGSIIQRDMFVGKLVDAGSNTAFAWAIRIGGENAENANVLLATSNVLYLCGSFYRSVAFGTTTLVSTGISDAYVTKMIDAGSTVSFAWAQRAGGSGRAPATSISLKDSTLYVCGGFGHTGGSTATFGQYTLSGTTSYLTGYIASLGTNGRLVPTATRPEDLAAVALFPNPARQTATLTLPAALAAQGAHVTLLNSLGQWVQQRTLPPHAPSLELDLAGLAAGVYSVQVRVGTQVLTRRLAVL